jgi:AraC-like DNA-binding protein
LISKIQNIKVLFADVLVGSNVQKVFFCNFTLSKKIVMENLDYFGRISFEELNAENNVFSKIEDLIVSQKSTAIRSFSFDWKYPHILEGIGFTFCIKGRAVITVNLTRYVVEANMVGVILPNSLVQIEEQSEDFEIEFIICSFDFISDIQLTKEFGVIGNEVQQLPVFSVDEIIFKELLALHGFIVMQYEKSTTYSLEIVKSLLHSLIFLLLQCYSELQVLDNVPKKSRQKDIYRTFMSLLFQHYKNDRNVGFYADMLSLTPKYFSKIIKDTSGKTAGEWIDEIVIMAVKGMLKSSSLTVAQIADEFNFSNASFFGSYFKARTGQTPLEYRGLKLKIKD